MLAIKLYPTRKTCDFKDEINLINSVCLAFTMSKVENVCTLDPFEFYSKYRKHTRHA